MAMLSEPRQRKRYNLVPRGKALYEDENRFGTKMLEKMGWKKGTGLGAKEDGSKDFIRIRYKNDALGLGFEHRDDQWTQHEKSFNGLLKTLNNEENKQQGNDNESADEIPRVGFGFQDNTNQEPKSNSKKLKDKISGVSLEERSKQSRARVHYKKFTRGKDLTQYSEKDLANIFGKKEEGEQQGTSNFYQQLNNNFTATPEEDNDNEKEEEVPNMGVQIINSGVSVYDYFKMKMEALKNRKNGYDSAESSVNTETIPNEVQLEENCEKKNKKKKDKKRPGLVEEENLNETQKEDNGNIIYSNVSVTDYFKIKMEAIKNKKNGLNDFENVKENRNLVEELVQADEISEKKKKKKQKDKKTDHDTKVNLVNVKLEEMSGEGLKSKNFDTERTVDQSTEATKTKKKKDKTHKKEKEEIELQNEQVDTINKNLIAVKRKHESSTLDNELLITPIEISNEPLKKKKKKNKTKETNDEVIETVDNDNEKLIAAKRKHESSTLDDELLITPIEISNEEPLKKKKKKNKTKEPNEIIATVDNDNEMKNSAENETSSSDIRIKKKSNKNKKSRENSEKENEKLSSSNETESTSIHPHKNPLEVERKEVSSSENSILITDVNNQKLNLHEIKKQYNAFNIYTISSFCAEKFRNINLNNFTGSSLPQIEGYSISPELQLNVEMTINDEERITNLWKCVLNKYDKLEKPKNQYKHYVRDVIKARKSKQKAPKLNIKTWKRKNAFQLCIGSKVSGI